MNTTSACLSSWPSTASSLLCWKRAGPPLARRPATDSDSLPVGSFTIYSKSCRHRRRIHRVLRVDRVLLPRAFDSANAYGVIGDTIGGSTRGERGGRFTSVQQLARYNRSHGLPVCRSLPQALRGATLVVACSRSLIVSVLRDLDLTSSAARARVAAATLCSSSIAWPSS